MNAMLNKFPLAIGVATLLMATTGNLGAAALPVGFEDCANGGACALIRNGVKHTGTANPRSIGISAASASTTKSIDRSADFQSLEMTPHNSVTPRATARPASLTPATFTYSLNATAVTASAPDRADLHAASAPADPAPEISIWALAAIGAGLVGIALLRRSHSEREITIAAIRA